MVKSDDHVMQSPPSLIVHEGSNATLSCSYKVTFKACTGISRKRKVPTFPFALISTGIEKKLGRLIGTLDGKELLSTLHITVTELGDSATYLCAVEAQCFLGTCSLDPNATTEAPITVRWVSC